MWIFSTNMGEYFTCMSNHKLVKTQVLLYLSASAIFCHYFVMTFKLDIGLVSTPHLYKVNSRGVCCRPTQQLRLIIAIKLTLEYAQ